MDNICYNKVIITHDVFSKVKELYNIPSDDYFSTIYPLPDEESIHDGLERMEYNLEKFSTSIRTTGFIKDWSFRYPYHSSLQKTISSDSSFLTLTFESPWSPPILIYQELERQGYHVRAYFWSPTSWFCGTFIHGIGQWCELPCEECDLPFDVDRILGVKDYCEAYESDITDEDVNNSELTSSNKDDNICSGKNDEQNPIKMPEVDNMKIFEYMSKDIIF